MDNDSNIKAAVPCASSLPADGEAERFGLFPGISLEFLTLNGCRSIAGCSSGEKILEINYCKNGRLGLKLGGGQSVYLGPGDFSVHVSGSGTECVTPLPTGRYEGLRLLVDLSSLTREPPELLSGTGITGEMLCDKFSSGCPLSSYAGNHATAGIFDGFYGQPEELRTACLRVKTLELLLYLAKLAPPEDGNLTECRAEQVETVRRIHRHLMEHLDQRFTIEELSKEYLMNPTTLKEVFKSVYGTSIAAHIKEHRIEEAARLLRDDSLSLSDVAAKVGYTNQSKFTAAFKEQFGMLPREYRKQPPAPPRSDGRGPLI